jgi:hypothetical protein
MSIGVGEAQAALREFFEVEIRNEVQMRHDGDDPPVACLCTALESLQQAPNHVLLSWFDVDESGTLDVLVPALLGFAGMLAEYGLMRRLDDLLTDDEAWRWV